MYAWSDMSKVKKSLWNKLHTAKAAMKDSVNVLAQIMVTRAQSMIPQQVKSYMQLTPIVQRSNRPLFLAQTSTVEETNSTQVIVPKHHKKDDISSVK